MNTLYQGDNLAILREMPDASVDLIATDPPFNTGKDWGAFDDRWEGGLKGYLKFMEQRAVEMHRVLKDTGSLYLHCDPTASHYLKVMLDGVFGIKNFRNEIVWAYKKWSIQTPNFQPQHDIILRYSKSGQWVWNQLIEPSIKSYKTESYTTSDGRKSRRMTKTPIDGRYMRDIWDISVLNGMAKERLGYPCQKPLALLKRIIKASSNPNDIILDPFAGSGTTLDAAQTLGRRWIGIDQSAEAINVIQKRLEARHGLLIDYELRQET